MAIGVLAQFLNEPSAPHCQEKEAVIDNRFSPWLGYYCGLYQLPLP
jgi:hypothetical protein